MDDEIDFRDIVSKYSFQEHAQRADQYFATVDLASVIARKPFASVDEAAVISAGIGVILGNLKLFHGARVLDFGAGTCWFSRILASVGCDVVAADVSRNALELGRSITQGDPVLGALPISYSVISETTLPFADGTFDRIVVFDAFHHVPDQKALIREFYRVLKDDGIAAFHEPGPNHSRSKQSQYEMRNFDVIEGDVIVEDLISEAMACGFSDGELAVFATSPIMVKLDQFNKFLTESVSMAGLNLVEQATAESLNRRVFFLYKGDSDRKDSRAATGLACELELSASIDAGAVSIDGLITNTGTATWLPSMQGVGSVNIGVRLYDENGVLLNADYARAVLSNDPTGPGLSRHVTFTIPLPATQPFTIGVDLVAEGVTWFEMLGSQPAVFAL